MISVGCKFAPNDLSQEQWDDLISLAVEREWMRRKMEPIREERIEKQSKQNKAQRRARREAGIPNEGESLFKR